MEQLMLERLLLARTLGGDHDAFSVLGSMHWEQVYAVARDLSSSDEDALELTQGAFQEARNELSAISAKLSFRIFVCRFLVRAAIERLRLTALSPSGFVEVDGLDRRRDIADLTRAALARLDPNDRAALVLITAELPVGEAAAILEIPASLVRKRARRARLLVSGCIRDLTPVIARLWRLSSASFELAAALHLRRSSTNSTRDIAAPV
jgi:RNA polymerase sigma-70 factor, ECF subfamily